MPARSASRAASTRTASVTARKCEVWWNGGAYADIGPRVTQKSGFTAAGPYDIDNVSDRLLRALHQPDAGRRAARLRHPAAGVGLREPHRHDRRARSKLDPLEFRRKNILRDGRPQATGTVMKDAAIEAVLERAAERMNWAQPFDRGSGTVRRGRGLGIALKAVISPTTSVAIVNVNRRRRAASSIAAPSTWARAPTPPWRRWSARCSTCRPSRSRWCRATPTSRPTTWARSARARCSTWATRCGSPPRMRATSSRRWREDVGVPEG